MKQGTLITIDGIDGVGKNTQAKMLKERIEFEHGQCGFFSFPRYNTPTGALVGKYLRGEMGELSMLERSKLYSDDRLAARKEMLLLLNNGVDVVCDRYVDSNTAYFSSFEKISPELFEECPDGVIKAIEDLEYGEYQLPIADLTCLLILPTEQAKAMVAKKAQRDYTTETEDLHERDKRLLQYALEHYDALQGSAPRYKKIDCSSGEGVQTPAEIHNTIYQQYLNAKEKRHGQIQPEGC